MTGEEKEEEVEEEEVEKPKLSLFQRKLSLGVREKERRINKKEGRFSFGLTPATLLHTTTQREDTPAKMVREQQTHYCY